MSTGSGAATRRLLGIRDDQIVVLYAPTWRDDHEETMVDFLDRPQFAGQLGADYVVRLRGQRVVGGVAAAPAAAPVHRVHGGVRLEQRQHGLPAGVVGGRPVHQEQVRS